ncbi:unnamed protein product [Sympodiomycopsis kandeliae]
MLSGLRSQSRSRLANSSSLTISHRLPKLLPSQLPCPNHLTCRSNSNDAASSRHGLSFGSMRKPSPPDSSPPQASQPPQPKTEASWPQSNSPNTRHGISFNTRRNQGQASEQSGDRNQRNNNNGDRNQRSRQGSDRGVRTFQNDRPQRQGNGRAQRWGFGVSDNQDRPASFRGQDASRSQGSRQTNASGRSSNAGPSSSRWASDEPDKERAPRGEQRQRGPGNGREQFSSRLTGQQESTSQQKEQQPGPRKTNLPSAKNWRIPEEKSPRKNTTEEDAEPEPIRSPPRSSKEKELDRRLKEIAQGPKEVFLPELISVNNLARLIGIRLKRLQSTMTEAGLSDTRPAALLNFDDSSLLCAEYNLNAVSNEEAAFDIYPAVSPTAAEKAAMPFRPPVITVMGHVDHGKTSLLDRLRSASVAAGEAGGITQHIGAFSVPVKAAASDAANAVKKITFLDTPGHAAFSSMRARGAKATDIVVLVVAADDGVMAQTKEVIDLYQSLEAEARAAAEGEEQEQQQEGSNRPKKQNNIQLLVAFTKCDRPAADTRRAKEQLAAQGIMVEELSGDVPSVEISSKTGQGFDTLEETLAVMAELGDLRAPSTGQPEGIVLESRTEKGLGNTATVLISRGKLVPGSYLIAGKSWAKVRGMVDSNGKSVKVASPGEAVLVSGWKDLPDAGEEVLSAAKEDLVKKAVENRKEAETRKAMVKEAEAINEFRRKKREEDDRAAQAEYEERQRRREIRMADETGKAMSSDAANNKSVDANASSNGEESGDGEMEIREVRLIIKSDFSGTGEALEGAISGLVLACPGYLARVKILSMGVGDLSDSDLSMARAGVGHHTAMIGFNVKASRSIQQEAKNHGIEVYNSAIIYQIIDYVKSSLSQVLPRKIETRVTGEATVAQTFSIAAGKNSIKVAGVRITNGVIARSKMVRVLRPSSSSASARFDEDEEKKMDMIFEGRLSSIKQVKKEVNEMRKGTECGLSFDGFDDVREGDVVHCIEQTEVAIPFK